MTTVQEELDAPSTQRPVTCIVTLAAGCVLVAAAAAGEPDESSTPPGEHRQPAVELQVCQQQPAEHAHRRERGVAPDRADPRAWRCGSLTAAPASVATAHRPTSDGQQRLHAALRLRQQPAAVAGRRAAHRRRRARGTSWSCCAAARTAQRDAPSESRTARDAHGCGPGAGWWTPASIRRASARPGRPVGDPVADNATDGRPRRSTAASRSRSTGPRRGSSRAGSPASPEPSSNLQRGEPMDNRLPDPGRERGRHRRAGRPRRGREGASTDAEPQRGEHYELRDPFARGHVPRARR
ncbi:MAG: hypothetical protein MZW92_44805 [Comamonadaceae bacterium]|nr:hypothetical protein [Comamonadaceae bacterium]